MRGYPQTQGSLRSEPNKKQSSTLCQLYQSNRSVQVTVLSSVRTAQRDNSLARHKGVWSTPDPRRLVLGSHDARGALSDTGTQSDYLGFVRRCPIRKQSLQTLRPTLPAKPSSAAVFL